MQEMQAAGITRAIGLVMAPHYSRMSVGAYFKKIDEAELPLQVEPIEHWHLLPEYIGALRSRVQAALECFPAEVRAGVPIIFTAHSLPQRILEWNDPYPQELEATVARVMQGLGDNRYEFAFQSAAISSEPWLGPEAGAVIRRMASEGSRNILLCPIGFVSEHVEILYDVDIVYQRLAKSLDVHLERIEMLKDDQELMSGLARLVRGAAQKAQWL